MKRLLLAAISVITLIAQSQPGYTAATYLVNSQFMQFLQGAGVNGQKPYIEVFIFDQGLHADGYRVDLTYVSAEDGITRRITRDVPNTAAALLDIYWFDATSASAVVTPYKLVKP